ncbi:GH16961 [Drosophila grimshawi]|uniref:GH16961 n=1 Tax=Drosophila grimshawi TaxID=7222 RepID=B4IYD2_DROGR|nr:GH16961 [Drosophila grimshawi]
MPEQQQHQPHSRKRKQAQLKGVSWGNQLPDMLVAYFRQCGVHNLLLVVCHADIDAKLLSLLLQHFGAHNFYVQVITESCLNDLTHWRNETLTPEAPPPRSFVVDYVTHWPVSFELPPLSYKLGILLLRFNSPCALNLLRWSAATEHNYFTTNRFWLLLTQDIQDLELLGDEEIFIPPDSEMRVLWHSLGEESSFNVTLIDVYKVAAWKPLKRRLVGKHLRNPRHIVHALQHFGSAITYRQNLEGIVFNTAIVVAFPDMFTNIEDMTQRHIDTISKVNHRLMLELANQFNIIYIFFSVS